MNCDQVQQLLKAKSVNVTADSALQAHLAECNSCQDLYQEYRLNALLSNTPIPPSSPGFADRALAQAWESAHGETQRGYKRSIQWSGLAASVLLAGVVVLKTVESPQDPEFQSPQVVGVQPHETHPVHIRLVSKEAYPDATISVQLSGNVSLEGYSELKTVTWQAPIEAGNNQLSLPIIYHGANNGDIVVEVSSNGARKSLQFQVKSQTSRTVATSNQTLSHDLTI